METRQDLLRLESAWHRAVCQTVSHMGVSKSWFLLHGWRYVGSNLARHSVSVLVDGLVRAYHRLSQFSFSKHPLSRKVILASKMVKKDLILEQYL